MIAIKTSRCSEAVAARGLAAEAAGLNGQRGAAVVEFAIVLPLLLVIVFGIIEFGLICYNKQIITNASREGARAGIARVTESKVKEIVENYCENRILPKSANVPDATVTGIAGSYGEDLTVTVSYSHKFLLPDLLGFGTSIQLTGKTVMLMESVSGS